MLTNIGKRQGDMVNDVLRWLSSAAAPMRKISAAFKKYSLISGS
jgi:hypothetical protein